MKYAFAQLLLFLATIVGCIYSNMDDYRKRKQYLINEKAIDKGISILTDDDKDSIRIKQLWKDHNSIHPYDGSSWTLGCYAAIVFFTLITIIAYAIFEFKEEHSVLGIFLRIGIPIILNAIIWAVYYFCIKRKYKEYYISSISSLQDRLDDDATNFKEIESDIQTIFEDELTVKARFNRYCSAMVIILILALITLSTSFFDKTEIEIEEEEAEREKIYQSGYNDGKGDWYKEGYDEGYDVGIDVSKDEWYEEGYRDGYNHGYDEGNDEGYDKAKDEWYNEGLSVGYEEGKEKGYSEGFDEGYVEGYGNGYEEGRNE